MAKSSVTTNNYMLQLYLIHAEQHIIPAYPTYKTKKIISLYCVN